MPKACGCPPVSHTPWVSVSFTNDLESPFSLHLHSQLFYLPFLSPFPLSTSLPPSPSLSSPAFSHAFSPQQPLTLLPREIRPLSPKSFCEIAFPHASLTVYTAPSSKKSRETWRPGLQPLLFCPPSLGFLPVLLASPPPSSPSISSPLFVTYHSFQPIVAPKGSWGGGSGSFSILSIIPSPYFLHKQFMVSQSCKKCFVNTP